MIVSNIVKIVYTFLVYVNILRWRTMIRVCHNAVTDCTDLSSTQEETDARTYIILYTLNANKCYKENNTKGQIMAKSPGTYTFPCY